MSPVAPVAPTGPCGPVAPVSPLKAVQPVNPHRNMTRAKLRMDTMNSFFQDFIFISSFSVHIRDLLFSYFPVILYCFFIRKSLYAGAK
jgi:hypothetical protein